MKKAVVTALFLISIFGWISQALAQDDSPCCGGITIEIPIGPQRPPRRPNNPPPAPPPVSVVPLFGDDQKGEARTISLAGSTLSSALAVAAGVTCGTAQWTLCAITSLTGLGTSMATLYFERIALDPWDPNYGSPYEYTIDPYEQSQYFWECNTIYNTTNPGDFVNYACQELIDLQLNLNAAANAVATTSDRMQSCVLANDPCAYWQRDIDVNFVHNNLVPELYYMGIDYVSLSDYLYSIGWNDDNDTTGQIRAYGYQLLEACNVFSYAY